MRIVVGLRSLFPGKVGGLETYVRELLRAWGESRRDDEWIVQLNPEAAASFTSPGPWMRFEVPGPAFDVPAWKAAAERHAPAVYFSPMLVIDPPDIALPTVVNIPDVQHLHYPEFFDSETLAFRHLHFPLSARRAAAVVTLSAHARQSIIEGFGAKPERVHDILLAAGPQFRAEVAGEAVREFRARHELPERFGYFPANFWPHKNHATLFAALKRLRREDGDAPHVVLSGFAGGNRDAVRATIRAAGLEDRVRILGYLESAEVPLAYRAADFLVFPSLYEGFGIPVAEAMASGCPVIASEATSIPELAGDAALLFDPHSPAALAARLRELLGDPAKRAELIARGLRRSGELTWARAADETWAVLHGVADHLAAGKKTPVAALHLDAEGRIDPAALPPAEPAPILHFQRPGDRLDGEAIARVRRRFSGSGLAALIGATRPIAAKGAPDATPEPGFSTLRLKSADCLALERLWIGPEASAEFLAWLAAQPATPEPYEMLLRAAISGPVGEEPGALTLVAAPPPPPVAPALGARISHRQFGVADDAWIHHWAKAVLGRLARRDRNNHPPRGWRRVLQRAVEFWLWRRLTGVVPPALGLLFKQWLRKAPPAGPGPDGWIGGRARLILARPDDGVLRLRIEAVNWPDAHPPWVTIRAGRRRLYRGCFSQPGIYDLSWPWPGEEKKLTLDLRCSEIFIPAEHNIGPDYRRLSVRVQPG